jgi:hypothetical protein
VSERESKVMLNRVEIKIPSKPKHTISHRLNDVTCVNLRACTHRCDDASTYHEYFLTKNGIFTIMRRSLDVTMESLLNRVTKSVRYVAVKSINSRSILCTHDVCKPS